MKVLVTGGAGYVGSHVCKRLAAAGHEPITYDNLSRGNAWAVKWGPLECGDLADGARLRAVIARHRPMAVMHFGAYAYVGESCVQPMLYYANNVGGSQVLLAAVAEAGPLPVVFSSTCATYGPPLNLPIGEDHPQVPLEFFHVVAHAANAELAEVREILPDLRGVQLKLLGQRFGGNRFDAGRVERIQAAQVD